MRSDNEYNLFSLAIDSIVKCARRVVIVGATDKFRAMLGEFFTQKGRTEIFYIDDPAEGAGLIEAQDAIFLATLDPGKHEEAVKQLLSDGAKLEQIIPAGHFFVKFLAEKYGFMKHPEGRYLIPYYANFDLVDTCNLQCSTCIRSVNRGSSHRIGKEMFIKCIDKLQEIGCVMLEMHNRSEPFLHPQLEEFVAEAKKRDFQVVISTNFSLKNDGKRALKILDMFDRQGDLIVISISGLDQNIYAIDHVGGNIELVLENLKIASQSVNRKKIILRLLNFSYNTPYIPRVRELANDLGISYQIFPAGGDPEKKKLYCGDFDTYDTNFGEYSTAFEYLEPCPWIFCNNIIINSFGNVHLCCNCDVHDYDLGSFLLQDFAMIQIKRWLHPLCQHCASGRNFGVGDDSWKASEELTNIINQGWRNIRLYNQLKLPKIFGNGNVLARSSDYFARQM